MNVLIVYAHPSPRSFNHAILEAFAKPFQAHGHTVVVRDLYGIRFDPVLTEADLGALNRGTARLDVAEEQRHVKEADLIAFLFPVWWFSEPAILKGWIDRVFSMGFAFRLEDQAAVALLTGKKSVTFRTCGADQSVFDTGLGAAMETIFENGTLRACGLDSVLTRFFYQIEGSTDLQRQTMLMQVRQDAELLAAPTQKG
jgi:NAD(P)H dehydrogenase (quinone)